MSIIRPGEIGRLNDLGVLDSISDKIPIYDASKGVINSINASRIATDSAASVITITSDRTLSIPEDTILVDATSNTVTVSLPTAIGISGIQWTIKAINVDNMVVLDTFGSETIDGASSLNFVLNQARTVQSDGANWQQVA